MANEEHTANPHTLPDDPDLGVYQNQWGTISIKQEDALGVSRKYRASRVTHRIRSIALFSILFAACTHRSTSEIPYGDVGSLVVSVVDATGTPRISNAYLAEDPRVTSEVIVGGHAGVWADEKGIARLGAWRPGKYTLMVRALGYYQERRSVTLRAGETATVRVVLRRMDMTLQ